MGGTQVLRTPGGTLWLTGLPSAGKTTTGEAVWGLLAQHQLHCHLLDGDELREGLNADLSFSDADRAENVRRLGEVAVLLACQGCLSIVSAISPRAASRDAVRHRHEVLGLRFVEVHVATPLEVCEARDPKGLYARARRGELGAFTGVSAPYEPPACPELVLGTEATPEQVAREVLQAMFDAALIS
jgi:bifunctional enzyme CysN/CysC